MPDAFGFVTPDNQLIFNNEANGIAVDEGLEKGQNLLRGQAYLQKLYDDIAKDRMILANVLSRLVEMDTDLLLAINGARAEWADFSCMPLVEMDLGAAVRSNSLCDST